MSRHVPGHSFQLAPGLRVVARGRDRLQIGLDRETRLVLRRSARVEALLADLSSGRAPEIDSVDAATTLDRLRQAGVVVADDDVVRARRTRTCARVHVLSAGSAGVRPVAEQASALLADAGLRTATPATTADVVLVVVLGEVRRELLDPLVRADTPHLVVRLVDGGAVLGPFVAPGDTACVRCIDAHRSVADPDHVVVTARYVLATERPRADGIGDLPDPLLTAQALTASVRDVVAHLEGREPATWSRTIRLGQDPGRRTEEHWLRHPRCGCSLTGDLGLSGTMGA